MELSFKTLAAIQIGWVLASIWRFIKRSDEVPLLASAMVAYFGCYRYFTVLMGWNEWGDITNLGFSEVTNETALIALRAMVIGESVFLAAYFVFQKQTFPPVRLSLAPAFARQVRGQAFTAALVLLPLTYLVNAIVAGKMAAGISMAFGISAYLYLFPLILSSVAVVLVILWRYGNLPSGDRWFALGMVGLIFYTTYGVSGRFKFLSWLIAGAVILSASYSAKRRLGFMAAVSAGILAMFAVAGAKRGDAYYVDGMAAEAAWARFQTAEDANMLDGMVYVQQVIPSRLPFRYGGEHLEILYRPIPRAWWPNKPVTAYMLKISGMDQERGATLGISPSLFGSFYVEGGMIGVVLGSFIYAYLIAKLFSIAAPLHPFASLLVRCLVCASLVPLLRGGDLPGVYAWLVMAFWPLLLLLLFKRKQLSKNSPWFLNTPEAGAAPVSDRFRRRGRARLSAAPALTRYRS